MGYLDDIIIYSRSEKEHLEHLEEIFIRLKAAGLKLKLEKCCFFKKHKPTTHSTQMHQNMHMQAYWHNATMVQTTPSHM